MNLAVFESPSNKTSAAEATRRFAPAGTADSLSRWAAVDPVPLWLSKYFDTTMAS